MAGSCEIKVRLAVILPELRNEGVARDCLQEPSLSRIRFSRVVPTAH